MDTRRVGVATIACLTLLVAAGCGGGEGGGGGPAAAPAAQQVGAVWQSVRKDVSSPWYRAFADEVEPTVAERGVRLRARDCERRDGHTTVTLAVDNPAGGEATFLLELGIADGTRVGATLAFFTASVPSGPSTLTVSTTAVPAEEIDRLRKRVWLNLPAKPTTCQVHVVGTAADAASVVDDEQELAELSVPVGGRAG